MPDQPTDLDVNASLGKATAEATVGYPTPDTTGQDDGFLLGYYAAAAIEADAASTYLRRHLGREINRLQTCGHSFERIASIIGVSRSRAHQLATVPTGEHAEPLSKEDALVRIGEIRAQLGTENPVQMLDDIDKLLRDALAALANGNGSALRAKLREALTYSTTRSFP